MRRGLVTLLAVGIWIAMGEIPLPYLDVALLEQWIGQSVLIDASLADFGLSLTVLGTAPFLTGFVLVELGAMLLVRGRARIRGGPADREVLWRMAILVSLAFAGLQAWAIAIGLEQMRVGLQPIFTWDGPPLGFRIVITLTLMASTAILVGLVRWVRRAGIGHGFVVFLLVEGVRGLWSHSVGAVTEERLAPLVVVGIVAILMVRYARPPLLLWGLLNPLGIAIWLAPTTRAQFVLEPWQIGGSAAALVASMFIVTWAARRPELVATLGNADHRERRKRAAQRIVVRAFVLITFVIGLLFVLIRSTGEVDALIAAPVLTAFLAALALSLDLAREVSERLRRGGSWVVAWPLHQPYRVGPARLALEQAGIPHFLRGLHYRTLTGPFDPRVPIDVMVPEDRLVEARELLDVALALRMDEGAP